MRRATEAFRLTLIGIKKNELGDIAEIYGVNGKICEYRYDAWGNYRLIDSGTGMDVTKDQVIGGISTNVSVHIGHINPFRYRGYYYDEETGFYYLNTRYYDPEIRRFINMDNPELVAQLPDARSAQPVCLLQ